MVLSGVAPPDYKLPLEFARTIQDSLEHLFDDCAADPDCHRDFPNLKTEFQTVIERLDRQPAEYPFALGSAQPRTIRLSRGAFVSDLRTMLYQPGIVPRLPYILHRAFENDFQPFTTVAVATRQATSASVARGMSFSVSCSEWLPFISEADICKATAGTYVADFDVRTYQTSCRSWTYANVPKSFLEPVRSDVPVLLIAGVRDAATPPRMAEHPWPRSIRVVSTKFEIRRFSHWRRRRRTLTPFALRSHLTDTIVRTNIAGLIVFGVLTAAVSAPAEAQTQREMTDQSCGKLKQADTELNRVYQQILTTNAKDAEFVKALREAQRAWITFRDAHIKALYPSTDPQAYGSANASCRCSVTEQLTTQRTKQLRDLWIAGTPEGDVCAGSSPPKK